MRKHACDCSACRMRDARAYWAIIAASYSADELETLYPDHGMRAAVMFYALARGELVVSAP